MFPTSQTSGARPFETAPQPVAGLAEDLPSRSVTPWHSHQRAQLLYPQRGVLWVSTERASFLVPPSAALFLPSGLMHRIRMDGPVALRTLFLRPDAAARSGRETDAPAVLTVNALLRELILAACDEPLDGPAEGRLHHLSELVLDEIARAFVLDLRLAMPKDGRLLRVVELLQANPAADLSLAHLADEAGASERTLARLFRAETGISFRQYRQQVRLSAAMAALTMGATPARAARVAGYISQSTFGAAFRARFATPPGQVRATGESQR